MDKETWLNQGTEKLTAEELTMVIGDRKVKVSGFWAHKKATEAYVIVSIQDDGIWKEWYVPYVYRWHNTFIDTIPDLVKRIKSCRPSLKVSSINVFKAEIKKRSKKIFGENSTVTLPIFKKLLENCGKWICNREFKSSNPQKRIQVLKQKGFTITTKLKDKKTYHMLLPFAMVEAPTYETIPAKVRKAIFEALEGKDAFNDKPVGRSALPDHKFPEIRWTADTSESNEGLSEDSMRDKFQLVPEFVNQAKREVCRGCFQTGNRGKFSGIDFFYQGDDKWPPGTPTMGKDAESGCVGCFWYDMAAWRDALNKFIRENKG